ncbi:type II toxin-antitoxin system VapC family toxin [Microbacterium sp.]|uniref:type II toxin-antitoxin system VapC family toxin n=1 Tax=Microbacterium sp. TaxID=51671 RepID=UPI002622F0A0|nr:type II toxin-antitoxin system VapC family toxin [Microbacterium sp.]
MIVPDASAIALLFANSDVEPRATQAVTVLRADTAWVVPEHWRAEVLSTVRRLTRGGKLEAKRASRAVEWLQRVTALTVPTESVLPRMWELRDNLSAYGAGYVAVAEAHDLTLVTADVRIARADVARCSVRLVV